MAYEPTTQELAAIVDMQSLLSWAGLSNAPEPSYDLVRAMDLELGMDATGSEVERESLQGSFLGWLRAPPNAHFRVLASISATSFEAAMRASPGGWQCNGVPPGIFQVGAAILAHHTARCI